MTTPGGRPPIAPALTASKPILTGSAGGRPSPTGGAVSAASSSTIFLYEPTEGSPEVSF